MRILALALGTVALLAIPRASLAQLGPPPPVPPAQCDPNDLACFIPTLYGPLGLVVDSDFTFHSSHFLGPFEERFLVINEGIARELSTLPIPSPATGISFSFDPVTGTFVRSTRSFGPIFGERANTIGKKKMSLGFTFQHFVFNEIDGISLGDLPAALEHDPAGDTGFFQDIITTRTSISLSLNQFSAFFTYGLLDRLDVSVAVPVVGTDMAILSEATIQRVGSESTGIHFFVDGLDHANTTKNFGKNGSKTGIGDILVRAKGIALKKPTWGLALGADVRFPTGDELNFLGSGAWGVRPFAAFSFTKSKLGGHINAGYQWNGESVLSGSVKELQKADLADLFVMAVGGDYPVKDFVTLTFDFLFRRQNDADTLIATEFTTRDDARTFDTFDIVSRSISQSSLATGVKFNPGGNLLLDFNVLFRLDNNGLKHKPVPMAGFEYSF